MVFLKVKIIGKKGVIFVEIFTGFYCLFVASLSSKKGIKSPVMKHQKRNKIGMLEGGKMYKNVWKKALFPELLSEYKMKCLWKLPLVSSLVMKGKCKTSLGVTMKNLLKRVTFSEATQAKELNKRSSFLFTFFIF